MKQFAWITPSLLLVVAVSAHAADYPTALTLDHPEQRLIAAHPGKSLEAMQQACPQSMLNSAPATEARNISERILRTQDGVIIETDAELLNVPVGDAKKNVAATYRCEYRDGLLTLGIWTKGFVGLWTIYQLPQLTQNELGAPWPE